MHEREISKAVVRLFCTSSVLAGLVLGCVPPEPPEVTVTPSTLTLEVGETGQLSATSTDDADTFTWSSNNEATATVDDTGLVTAAGLGMATITATGSNSGESDTAQVNVTVPPTEGDGPPAAPLLSLNVVSTSEPDIDVTGTALANATIEVQGGAQTVMTAVGGAGAFSVNVPLMLNRDNRLVITAIDSLDRRSAPAHYTIVQDGVAPRLFIDFPEDGAELTNESISVAGRVADALSGFMGLEVEVNGAPADVDVGIGTNGTFERRQVPLSLGPNTITATGMDILGNTVTTSITVTRIALEGPRVTVISGGDQTGMVDTTLPSPLRVRVTNEDGSPLMNKLVTFDVTRSNGKLKLAADEAGDGLRMRQLRTDADGMAEVFWTLGSDAGCGNNRLRVISKDISGTAFFCATAMAAPPVQVNVGSGHGQKGETGGPLAEPLNAWVSDGLNPAADVPVTFRVTFGDGSLDLADDVSEVTVMTDATGHARVPFRLGETPGLNMVEALFEGNEALPAVFSATGVQRNEDVPTTFSGMVLDNANQPIGGVGVELEVNGEALPLTTTDVEGHFEFVDIPAGAGHVHLEGATANTLNGEPIDPGRFPELGFEITIVPNADNAPTRPVLLPELNPMNEVMYDGTEDVELTVEGMEGLRFIVRAGSMTNADGTVPSPENPAFLSLNQVHQDDVPMPMPDGATSPFAWTFQPANATFDPPVEVIAPNMSGMEPGSVVYFLSFNHDLNRFEIVASGSVTDDGAEVRTDPRSGIPVSGWGGNCPPYSVTGIVRNCFDVAVAFLEGNPRCPQAFPGVCPEQWSDMEFSSAFDELADEVRGLNGLRVTTRVFPGANSAETQLAAVERWVDSLIQPPVETMSEEESDTCSRPRLILVGHSLGGDTVRLSNAIAAEARIVAEPISRELVIDDFPGVPFYQRDLEFPPPMDANGSEDRFVTFLAADLPDAERGNCSNVGLDNFADIECVRGYSVTDDANGNVQVITVPGTDHRSIIESAPFRDHVVQEVEALLGGTGKQEGFVLDERFTLFADGQSFEVQPDGLFIMPNVSAPDFIGAGPPDMQRPDFIADEPISLVGVGEIDGQLAYLTSQSFRVIAGGVRVIRSFQMSADPPPFPKELLLDAAAVVLGPGEMSQLTTTSIMFDDTMADVTLVEDGTTYRSSNEERFFIDEAGVLTGVSNGVGFITAANNGVIATRRVTIVSDTIMTTVEGFVLDEDGNPIFGAMISTTAFGGSAMSGADGFFSFDLELPSTTQFITLTVMSDAGDFSSDLLQVVPDGITDGGLLAPRPVIVMTTVTGLVQLEDGTPVEDAAVFTNRGGQTLTESDGTFSLPLTIEAPGGNIPTLDVTARADIGEETLSGQATSVTVVPDGTTNAGTITIRSSVEVLYPGAVFPIGWAPNALRIADINNDSIDDVVAVTSVSGSQTGNVSELDISIGNGDGTYQNSMRFSTPFSGREVAVGDLDGDGNLDAVVTIEFNDEVSGAALHYGMGDGVFEAPPVILPGAADPDSVAIADVNDDGIPDLLFGDSSVSPDLLQVVIQLGEGDRMFGDPQTIELEGFLNALLINAADMNNDGDLDIVVVNRGSTAVEVLLGNGDGTFQEAQSYPVRFGPVATLIEDFNGDGFLDVATANQAIDVSVHINNGDGTLQDDVLYPAGSDPRSIASGDFDGDGAMDLVVVSSSGNLSDIVLLSGNGDGTFAEPEFLAVSRFAQRVAVSDVDQDGMQDLVVGLNQSNGSLLVIRGNGDGTFEVQQTLPTGDFGNEGLAVEDVTGDTTLDLVTVRRSDGAIVVLPGLGGGMFDDAIETMGPAIGGLGMVRFDDVDNDGDLDTLSMFRNPGRINFQLGNGDGTFADPVTLETGQSVVADATLADLDRDGANDLIYGPGPNFGIDVRLGLGGTTFEDPFELTTLDSAGDILAIDVNADNNVDIVSTGGSRVSVLIGNGDGSFGAPAGYSGGGFQVTAGDVNNDGFPDLVAAGTQSSIISIFLNRGDGTFDPAVDFDILTDRPTPRLLRVIDVNTDGAPDIVFAHDPFPAAGVLIGDGSGFFSGLTFYDLGGTFTQGLQVADINEDSLPDVVSANSGANNISLLFHR